MTIYKNHQGLNKAVKKVYVQHDGLWKESKETSIKHEGIWKTVDRARRGGLGNLGTHIAVANSNSHTVSIIRTSDHTVEKTVPVGSNPAYLAYN